MWSKHDTGAKNVDSTTMKTNSMRTLEGTHRSNLVNFINGLTPYDNTASHLMFKQADGYMRRSSIQIVLGPVIPAPRELHT